MSEFTTAQKAQALELAANTLDYVWKTTEESERAEAKAEDLETEFLWFTDGYLAAIEELRAAAGLLEEYAKGTIREVRGI